MDRVYLAVIRTRVKGGGSFFENCGSGDTPQKAAEAARKQMVKDWFVYRERAQHGHAKAAVYDITSHKNWTSEGGSVFDSETGEPIKRHSYEWVLYIAD